MIDAAIALKQLAEFKEESSSLLNSTLEALNNISFETINKESVEPFIDAIAEFQTKFKKICEKHKSKTVNLTTFKLVEGTLAKLKKTLESEVGYKKYLHENYDAIHIKNKKDATEQIQQLNDLITKNLADESKVAFEKLKLESNELMLHEIIECKIAYTPKPEEGHELDFIIKKNNSQALPTHEVKLNPLQYAAHLGAVDVFETLIAAIKDDKKARLWLTGEYGVSSLSYKSGCIDQIIPLIIEQFPLVVPAILKDAADNNQTQIYDIVMRGFSNAKHDLFNEKSIALVLNGLLSMHSPQYSDDAITSLCKELIDGDISNAVSKLPELRAYSESKQLPNILMINSLLENYRDLLDYRNDDSKNLLHILAKSDYDLPAVARKITKLRDDLDLPKQADKNGNLPLHDAVASNQFYTAQFLCAHCNVNHQNKDGDTALHIAAKQGNPEMVMMLYAAGCDPFITNNADEPETAIDIAKEQSEKVNAQLLQQRDRLKSQIKKINTIDIKLKHKKPLLTDLTNELEAYKAGNARRDNVSEITSNIEELITQVETVVSKYKDDELKKLITLIGKDELLKQKTRELQLLNYKIRKQSRTENVLQSITRLYENEEIEHAEIRKILYAVFKGGGAKGAAHLGAFVKAIEDGYIKLEDLKGVAGTSAGGIFALFVALGFSIEKIKDKLINLDFTTFLDDADPKFTKKVFYYINSIKDIMKGDAGWRTKINIATTISGFLEEIGTDFNSGIFKGDVFKEWIVSQILEKVSGTDILDHINVKLSHEEEIEYKKLDDEEEKENYILRKKISLLTFKDFHDHPDLIDLKLFGTDIATKRGEEYSYEKTPDMTILSAIRITMSLPIIFQPAYIEERVFVEEKEGKKYYRLERASDTPKMDGGYFDNFPVNTFDKDGMYNPNVLGFCLVPPEEFFEFARKELPDINHIDEKSFIHYLVQMAVAGLFGQQDYYHGQGIDTERTVYLSTLDVDTLDMNLSKDKKQTLIDLGGKVGMLDYEGSHRHALESVELSHHTRKRLAKFGIRKDFTHNKHIHGRFEPGKLLHPVEILKLYGKAEESDLKFLRMLVNTNTRDENHVTALHLAKALNLKDTYDRLVLCQANENAKNIKGGLAKEATWNDINDDKIKAMLPECLFDGNAVTGDEETFKKLSKDKLKQKNAELLGEIEQLTQDGQEAENRMNGEIDKLTQDNQEAEDKLKENIQQLTSEKQGLQKRLTDNLQLEYYQSHIKQKVLQPIKNIIKDDMSDKTKTALEKTHDELKRVLDAPSKLTGSDRVLELKNGLVTKINDILDGKVEDCKPLLDQSWGVVLLKALLAIVICVFTLGIPPIASKSFRSFFFRSENAHAVWKLSDKAEAFEPDKVEAATLT